MLNLFWLFVLFLAFGFASPMITYTHIKQRIYPFFFFKSPSQWKVLHRAWLLKRHGNLEASSKIQEGLQNDEIRLSISISFIRSILRVRKFTLLLSIRLVEVYSGQNLQAGTGTSENYLGQDSFRGRDM